MNPQFQQLLERLPALLGLFKGGNAGAAYMQNYVQSQQGLDQQRQRQQQIDAQREENTAYRQFQMQNTQRDNERAEQSAEAQRTQQALARLRNYRGDMADRGTQIAETATDPLQAQNQLAVEAFEQQQPYGVPPTAAAGVLPDMTAKISGRKKKHAEELYKKFADAYKDKAPEAENSIRQSAGEFAGKTMREIREIAETFAPQPSAKAPNPATRGSFEEYLDLPPDQQAVRRQQRKDYMQADDAPRQPRDERIVQIEGPGGQAIWVRESQAEGKPAAQAARAVTGMERQTLAFFNRAKEADELAVKFEDSSQNLAREYQQQYAPNVAQTREQQQYRQAQRAFTEARLRKESGAAIPTQEYENDARTYFAQPGDDPATKAQKRTARQTVLNGLKFSSGRAYEEFYGEPPARPSPGGDADSALEILNRRRQNRGPQ